MGKNKSNNQKDRWMGVNKINKNNILEYAEERLAQGKYEKTIYGETTTLIKLARFLKKEFRYATEKDMKNFNSVYKVLLQKRCYLKLYQLESKNYLKK